MGSDLSVPELIVFLSNTREIRGGPDSCLFKAVGFRFNENMDFQPSRLSLLGSELPVRILYH